MALAEARSHLVDRNRRVVLFDEAKPPKTFYIVLVCRNGHPSGLPADLRMEWWFQSPANAPVGCDAVILGYNTAVYRTLRALARVAAKGWILWLIGYPLLILAVNGLLRPRPLWIGTALTMILLYLLIVLPQWRSYYDEALRANYVRLGDC